MKITYLGHSCFRFDVADKKIIIDPFIKSSPKFFESTLNVAKQVDYILLTHGHSDHIGDTIEIALGCGATVISNYEICNWLSSKGVSCFDLNMGKTVLESGIEIIMVPAIHSSSIELDDGKNLYAGLACGYIIRYKDQVIYHAGDTCLFSDMKLINDLYHPNVGLIPIGGRFTMSISEAIYACENFFTFDTVIPMHFDTFPPIKANPSDLVDSISNSCVKTLKIGESIII